MYCVMSLLLMILCGRLKISKGKVMTWICPQIHTNEIGLLISGLKIKYIY